MTSPNETDRQTVRDTFKRWAHPQTAIALLHLGYDRDMVREEMRAVLELLDRVDDSMGRP